MRILRVVKCLRHLLLAQRHSRENENDCDKKGDSLLPSDSQHEKKKKIFWKEEGGRGLGSRMNAIRRHRCSLTVVPSIIPKWSRYIHVQ